MIGCCSSFGVVFGFKYDNVAFKTIYMEDLCQELKKQPQALLLDVRSPGEYSDTSMYENLRIGRLKGAKNIDIGDLNKRMNELPVDKNQSIFVYCSPSSAAGGFRKPLSTAAIKVYNQWGRDGIEHASQQQLPASMIGAKLPAVYNG
jgi:rhodanese-related sulfurtransferase